MHPAVVDYFSVLRAGLVRGQRLLTAGEFHVVQALLGLQGENALLYVRMLHRAGSVFNLHTFSTPGVLDPSASGEMLESGGFVDRLVPTSAVIAHLDLAGLREVARRLGLATTGRKAVLADRIRPLACRRDLPGPLGPPAARITG